MHFGNVRYDYTAEKTNLPKLDIVDVFKCVTLL